ncbi:FG-GAP-like repeat-containing protein [Patescibacteria group bacterium]
MKGQIVFYFIVSSIIAVFLLFPKTAESYSEVQAATGETYYHILSTGQSLSIGSHGEPALTTMQPFDNLMLSGSDLVPLVEGMNYRGENVETISSAMANTITALRNSSPSTQVIVSRHGASAKSYAELKKGSDPFIQGMSQVAMAKLASEAEGKQYQVIGVTAIHGEKDHLTLSNPDVYENYLLEWQNDYSDQVKEISGQSAAVPLFTDQMGSWMDYGSVSSRIPIAQLAAAEKYPDIYLVGPKYFLRYDDVHHLANTSYRWLGEYYGKVIKKVVFDNISWKPLSPETITRQGSVITVTFHVPVEPITIDVSSVLEKENYGFEYFDESGDPARITDVTKVNGDTIQISLDRVPTGENQRLRYAYTGSIGAKPGSFMQGSARGNIRDSDTTPSLYGNALYNWLVHFDTPIASTSDDVLISDIYPNVQKDTVTITWKTNTATTSQVEFGFAHTYGSTTSLSHTVNKVTHHSLELQGLPSCTDYHFRVRSIDVQGNEFVSGDQIFKTSCLPEEEDESAIPFVKGQSFLGYNPTIRGGYQISAGNISGDDKEEIIVGTGNAMGPHVRIFNDKGEFLTHFFAYEQELRNGVSVLACQVDGSGYEEIVTSQGSGGEPIVKIFNGDGKIIHEGFSVLDGAFSGGLNLACGDINGDGLSEIIVTAKQGGGPHVVAYNANGHVVANFMAYGSEFRGGISVTALDTDGDGKDEIITGPRNGTPHIQTFQVRNGEIKRLSPGFFAFSPDYRNGVDVTAADTNGDGKKELVVGVGAGSKPLVKVFNTRMELQHQFFAYGSDFFGGLHLGAGDVNNDGADEIVIVPRSQGGPQVRIIGSLSEVSYLQTINNLNSDVPGKGFDALNPYQLLSSPMASGLILSAEANHYAYNHNQQAQEIMDKCGFWLLENSDLDNDGVIGYGLPAAWDAFGDGSTNSAHSEYTITTSVVIKGLLDWLEADSTAPREQIYDTIRQSLIPYLKGRATSPSGLIAYSLEESDRPYNVFNQAAFLAGQMQRFSLLEKDELMRWRIQYLADQIMLVVLQNKKQDPNGNWYWDQSFENVHAHDLAHVGLMLESANQYRISEGTYGDLFDLEKIVNHTEEFRLENGDWREFPSFEASSKTLYLWGLGMGLAALSKQPGTDELTNSLFNYHERYLVSQGYYSFVPGIRNVYTRHQAYLLLGLSEYLY